MTNFDAKYYQDGVTLLIDKPKDWTSFNVVGKIRGHLKWAYQIKKLKVGHAGTLDPLATGLLIVCIGKHTKQIAQYSKLSKEYTAQITFGYTTPSYDLETSPDAEFQYNHISKEKLIETLNSFIGNQDQTPPIYSAKSIKGKRAYKYAREGEEVEMPKSNITIHQIDLLEYDMPNIKIKVKCSSGTYIRSLAYDIGQRLNSGATLTNLVRNSIGQFKLEDAFTITEFEEKA